MWLGSIEKNNNNNNKTKTTTNKQKQNSIVLQKNKQASPMLKQN
jgi:hypothetical protein